MLSRRGVMPEPEYPSKASAFPATHWTLVSRARVDESEIAAKRRGEAVKRNLDAAGRTPPATHRTGAGNDTAGGALTAKAVMAMDEDEFAKLSEKDLARLRGDTL